MARLVLCLVLVACGSRAKSPPPIDNASVDIAPATLRFASQGHGYVWLEGKLAVEPRHGPERVLQQINGSTGTYITMIADLPDPGPITTYTVVLANAACVVRTTGKRALIRSGNSFPAAAPGPWSLVAELEHRRCPGRGEMEIVEGAWPALRVVEFGQGPNYSGAEGTHGEPIPEMAEWPEAERLAYTRGPGFSVMPMKSGELAWYADTAHGSWTYRLRDRQGRLLAEGNQTAVLRFGNTFYVDGKRL